MGCLSSFPLTNFYKMLYVFILSRWRMYITLVIDILVHYFMGKTQEVIFFFKFATEKEKKEKILCLCLYIYICISMQNIYTHMHLYTYICNVSIIRSVISILYLFKLSILKIYIKTFKFLLCWKIIHGYSLSCLRNN